VTGTVQSFIPSVSSGIIQAENGEKLRFELDSHADELQGGDIVEFERSGNGRCLAINVSLHRRWADLLNEKHRTLVNEFHQLVHLDA